jgi:ribonuclease T1
MSRWLKLTILVIAAFAAGQWWSQRQLAEQRSPDGTAGVAAAVTAAEPRTDGTQRASLPREATATLRAIEQGGPFPYNRDGVVFQNREHRLPERPRGYYHEYTVETPGSTDRGARRIIAGGNPPEAYYYTDDHYRSFRPVEPPR